jgi:hypothetical protein
MFDKCIRKRCDLFWGHSDSLQRMTLFETSVDGAKLVLGKKNINFLS